jgi:putative flippase GtrA
VFSEIVSKFSKKYPGLFQFVKFGIVGVANTGVDWVVFYVLINTFLSDFSSIAKAISFIVAMLNSYIWNTIWTFKKEYQKVKENKSTVFGKFFLVSLVGWGLNVLVYAIAAKDLQIEIFNRDLLPLVLASGAAIVWNFFANKFWTYKK